MTDDKITREDLASALRRVVPYAETRAEDMNETAAAVRENADAGVVADKQAREAEQQRDKAWEAVNHAKALLGSIEEYSPMPYEVYTRFEFRGKGKVTFQIANNLLEEV